MLSVREKYWRYSLVVLILGLGAVILGSLRGFVGGVLGAVTIYVLLRRQMRWLTAVRQWRRGAAASLLIAEALVLFLLPVSGVVWMVVARVQDATLDPQTVISAVKSAAAALNDRIGYDILQEGNIAALEQLLPRLGQWLVGAVADFAVNILMLVFVLYFMLVGGRPMESYFREILPFNRPTARGVMGEIHRIVRSNAIGIPLLAIVQGAVAWVGYMIFKVPAPMFWGVVTCFATVIPLFGTALVWLPLAAYMLITGSWGAALGLALYGALIVTHVDNVVRFLLQRHLADTHPLVTLFGVFLGLSLFGFMGIIFGPLLLEIFILCVNIFKRCYLDDKPDCNHFGE